MGINENILPLSDWLRLMYWHLGYNSGHQTGNWASSLGYVPQGYDLGFDEEKREKRCDTVWFISFATFHEDVNPKVIKIIEFWKKFLKNSVNAFIDMWLPGFFHKTLVLRTCTEVDVIISKLFLYQNWWFGLFPFKLLSFLNELSYSYQIGLKWKVFWSSFWDSLIWNAHLMF